MAISASERKFAFHQGTAFAELNTLLKRVRFRDPTKAERARIIELRDKIRAMRKGRTA